MTDQIKQDNQPMALDDEQRVKVLSPGLLVVKRFVRNRLAVVGLCIIVFMVLFSFLGGVLMPYTEKQTFYNDEIVSQEFAGVTENATFLFTARPGEQLPNLVQPSFIKAQADGRSAFELDGVKYFITQLGTDFYEIANAVDVGSALVVGARVNFKMNDGTAAPQALLDAFTQAVQANRDSFELDGNTYYLSRQGKTTTLSAGQPVAVASKMIFDMASQGESASYEMRKQAELALNQNQDSFRADGETYRLSHEPDADNAEVFKGDALIANMSHFVVKATAGDVFLTIGFKNAVEQAVDAGERFFTYADENGVEEKFELVRKNTEYTIRRDTLSKVVMKYAAPSKAHLLGTDANGMDLLTRLMYGGRISLRIGIIVVLIELLIGVVLGGIAGYFGGWLDNLLMRIVDIFNCLPYMPLIIIVGAVMDALRVDPSIRIYLLMVIMGVLGWPYTARLVRGQILSLREQEFMIATEATGMRIGKRIFRHLIPNVIPQLIVSATMGLGGIILTESTLSFLGLGVKFPLASWGNIINAVNDVYVMTNYAFVWVPGGILILLTVLGFNFIGDGLRDAFDPKMKR